MVFTNRPKFNANGSVPQEYYDADYWEKGAESGKGSYNGNAYETQLELCKVWAQDCYNRWGPFKDFLELGCGRGWNIWAYLHMPLLGINPRGVDLSHYAVTTAVEEVRPYITEHDASDLSFLGDLSYDTIFSNDFLEHLTPEQAERCLQHCNRISRHIVAHLISIGDGHDHEVGAYMPEQDQSHVTMKGVDWWLNMFNRVFNQTDWLLSIKHHGTTVEIVATRTKPG